MSVFETQAAIELQKAETDHGPDNTLERYYSDEAGTNEIVCTTDEREEFEQGKGNDFELQADVLPGWLFSEFKSFLMQNH